MIRVNETEITQAEIGAEMQHHPAPTQEEALHQAAEALVIRRLLLDEAALRGLHGDTEEAAVAALLDAAVSVPEADEDTCRRWFSANRAKLRSPEAWQAAHILLAAPKEDTAARQAAAAKAEGLAAELRADPARLPALAALHSACPSKEQGGDLGHVAPGSTVPEFEAALARMAPGEVAVAPSRYGIHVLRLEAHEPGRDLPFEAVHDRVAGWLQEASWRRAVHQYISILAGQARIEGFALAGADSPLVQ